jgi:hypothetical protein
LRFFIASLLFVASLVALLLGIAERTVWAPAPIHKLSIQLDTENPLVEIPNSVLTRFPGEPTVTVFGDGLVFAAQGRQADVNAWIGSTNHDVVALSNKGSDLAAASIEGGDLRANPAGSDLWRQQFTAQRTATFTTHVTDDAALLVASDGVDVAPRRIEFLWHVAYDLTLSNTLIITGSALLLIALIFNIWTYRLMRKNRGPRRKTPKAPHGPRTRKRHKSTNLVVPTKGRRSAKRAFLALPATVIVLASLTGCARSSTSPSASTPSPTVSVAPLPPAVVTKAQLEGILSKVSAVAAKADAARDGQVLSSRFTGAALAVRQANYLLLQKGSKTPALPKIVARPISFSLPEATATWPRCIMAVTDMPGDDALPQLVVLQQATPRSNYLVWYTVGLLPGATIPTVAAPEVGSVQVASDTLFLTLPPNQIPKAFGDLINRGAASLSSKYFDVENDEFYNQVSQAQADQIAKLKKGKIAFSHELGDPHIMSLATLKAGALVALYMTDIATIRPLSATSAVSVSGDEKIMLGADGSASGVRSVYGDMLLFYVPSSSDNGKIRLLGATQGLISVRGL